MKLAIGLLLLSTFALADIQLEVVVPSACLVAVSFDDVSKCKIEGVELAPTAECRGLVGEPLQCNGFVIKVTGCKYLVTKRKGCENIQVIKPAATAAGESKDATNPKVPVQK